MYDTRWNSCTQAATSGTCDLTKFAYRRAATYCVAWRNPSALQPYEGLLPRAEAGANFPTPKVRKAGNTSATYVSANEKLTQGLYRRRKSVTNCDFNLRPANP